MDVSFVEKETFYVYGYSVETTLEQNDQDVSALYDDFFHSGKETAFMELKGCEKGYYGLSWYTQGHERYRYLLGIAAGKDNAAPEKAVMKEVPKTSYAVARFPQGEDILKAWSEFFYNGIPAAGFKVNEMHNCYFEYYPGSAYGAFELWVPVVKAGV